MKNSADLGGFLDLQNSSYPTQPHSIISKCPLKADAHSTLEYRRVMFSQHFAQGRRMCEIIRNNYVLALHSWAKQQIGMVDAGSENKL